MKDNREKNDLVTKNFETFPDVAADIINALLHSGNNVVIKENLMPAPTESIYTTGENRLRNQLQDVVKYEMAGEGNTGRSNRGFTNYVVERCPKNSESMWMISRYISGRCVIFPQRCGRDSTAI